LAPKKNKEQLLANPIILIDIHKDKSS